MRTRRLKYLLFGMSRHPWFLAFKTFLPPLFDNILEKPQPLVAWRTTHSWQHDIFVSYRHAQAEAYAQKLAEELRKEGFSVFCAGEQTLPRDNEELLQQILSDHLRSSAGLVLIACNDPLGGEWTRWENDVFIEGRFGMFVPIMTDDTPEHEHHIFRMDASVWGIPVYEEEAGAWELREPSLTTRLNICLSLSYFKVLTKIQRWIWLVPKQFRREVFFRCVERDRKCRHYMGALISLFPYHYGWMINQATEEDWKRKSS